MSDVIEVANLLHMTPELFPWVVLAIVLIFVYKERNTIRNLFQSRIDANKEMKLHNAIVDELIRNNTAALNNNTAVLETIKVDRDITKNAIDGHEKMSMERIQHLQIVLNRIDKTVTRNNHIMGLLEDRTENSK